MIYACILQLIYQYGLLDLLQKSLINTVTADKKQMNTDKRR